MKPHHYAESDQGISVVLDAGSNIPRDFGASLGMVDGIDVADLLNKHEGCRILVDLFKPTTDHEDAMPCVSLDGPLFGGGHCDGHFYVGDNPFFRNGDPVGGGNFFFHTLDKVERFEAVAGADALGCFRVTMPDGWVMDIELLSQHVDQ